MLGDRVVSETPSSGDGVHFLGAIIGGVVLAVIIFVLLLTAAVIIIIMIAFMVNKHKAVYKPTPNRLLPWSLIILYVY